MDYEECNDLLMTAINFLIYMLCVVFCVHRTTQCQSSKFNCSKHIPSRVITHNSKRNDIFMHSLTLFSALTMHSNLHSSPVCCLYHFKEH